MQTVSNPERLIAWPIEKRVARLERLLQDLRARQETVYHRTYAATRRRRSVEKRVIKSAQKWVCRIGKYEKAGLFRLAHEVARKRRGFRCVYLNASEYMKFRTWLANDFRGATKTSWKKSRATAESN